MSDSYIYTGMDKYYAAEKTDNKAKILKVLVVVLSLFLILEALLYTVVMPCLSTAKVTFSGLSSLQADELLLEGGISSNVSWMEFDTAGFASSLASNAAIESVTVEKKFPDQILVKVTERAPVCCSLVNVDGKTLPIQIDKNGVIFSMGSQMSNNSMPLITGIELTAISDGMRIPTMYRTLIKQVEEIMQKNPAYFSALSEIRVIPTDYDSYELMLYPLQSHVRFLVDRSFNEDTLQYMMVVLDIIESVDPDVTEVDMRYGTISYKKA